MTETESSTPDLFRRLLELEGLSCDFGGLADAFMLLNDQLAADDQANNAVCVLHGLLFDKAAELTREVQATFSAYFAERPGKEGRAPGKPEEPLVGQYRAALAEARAKLAPIERRILDSLSQ